MKGRLSPASRVRVTGELPRRGDTVQDRACDARPGTGRAMAGPGRGRQCLQSGMDRHQHGRSRRWPLAEGVDTPLWLTAPELAGTTGRYFYQRSEEDLTHRSENADARRRLWTSPSDPSATQTGERPVPQGRKYTVSRHPFCLCHGCRGWPLEPNARSMICCPALSCEASDARVTDTTHTNPRPGWF